MQTLYSSESSDSLAQFIVWIFPMVAGGIGGYLFFAVGVWAGVLAGLVFGAALIAGLRASVTVTGSEAVIVKKCFFIPYRTYRAPEINDVWFGGDWGLEEGAMGVVVKLGHEEIHIGTSKNMRALYDALWPLSSSYKAMRSSEVAVSQVPPNPSCERTSPGKQGSASHLKR